MSRRDPPLEVADPVVWDLLARAGQRAFTTARLVPGESYASRAVLEALGSPLMSAEPDGARLDADPPSPAVDALEALASERLAALFGAEQVHVGLSGGASARRAVELALCEPDDGVLGLGHPALPPVSGGGALATRSYGLTRGGRVDLGDVRRQALEHRPRLLRCSASASPWQLELGELRQIADECGALLCVDLSGTASLVAAGLVPSPLGLADVVTCRTDGGLRGPRGSWLACRAEHRAAISRAVSVLAGRPPRQQLAAIAVAAREAAEPEFERQARAALENGRALAEALLRAGLSLVGGGTDTPLVLVELGAGGLPAAAAARALARAGIIVEARAIPFTGAAPDGASGLALGTEAVACRGLGPAEMALLASVCARALGAPRDASRLEALAREVEALVRGFPAPGLALT